MSNICYLVLGWQPRKMDCVYLSVLEGILCVCLGVCLQPEP